MSRVESEDVSTPCREYLAGLLEYLESFYQRTQPLSSLSKARPSLWPWLPEWGCCTLCWSVCVLPAFILAASLLCLLSHSRQAALPQSVASPGGVQHDAWLGALLCLAS